MTLVLVLLCCSVILVSANRLPAPIDVAALCLATLALLVLFFVTFHGFGR